MNENASAFYPGRIDRRVTAALLTCLGWALFWAWLGVATYSADLFPAGLSGLPAYELISLAAMLTLVVLRVGFACVAKFLDSKLCKTSCIAGSSLAAAVGAVVTLVDYYLLGEACAGLIVGSVLIAFGVAWLSTAWIAALSRSKAEESLLIIVLGFFISSLLSISVASLPAMMVGSFMVGAPVLIGTCLIAVFKLTRGYQADTSQIDLPPISKGYLVLLAIGIACYGLAGRVVRTISAAGTDAVLTSAALANNCHIIGIGVGAMVVCVFLMYLGLKGRGISTRSLSNGVLVFMALGMVVPALFSAISLYVASVIIGMACGCFEILLLAYAANVTRTRGTSPFLTIALAYGPMEFSNAFGQPVAQQLVAGIGAGAIDWPIIAMVALLVFILVSLAAFLPFDTKVFRPVEKPEEAAPAVAQGAVNISWMKERFGLTEREVEVATLLVAGRNIPYIRKALTISQSTAQTHAHHVYQKTGAHGQQELMDLADSENERV